MNTYASAIAVLNEPSSDEKYLTLVQGILTKLTSNAKLNNPTVSVAVFQGHVALYATAIGAARKGGPAARADRAAARKVVAGDVKLLMIYTQSVADLQGTAEDAVAVILGGGFAVKKIGKRVKPPLAAKNAGVPGVVLLVAYGLRKQATYYFEFSLDQKVWSSAPQSMKAGVTISGLTTMQVYYFRFRRLTRSGMSDYSQVVSLAVV